MSSVNVSASIESVVESVVGITPEQAIAMLLVSRPEAVQYLAPKPVSSVKCGKCGSMCIEHSTRNGIVLCTVCAPKIAQARPVTKSVAVQCGRCGALDTNTSTVNGMVLCSVCAFVPKSKSVPVPKIAQARPVVNVKPVTAACVSIDAAITVLEAQIQVKAQHNGQQLL